MYASLAKAVRIRAALKNLFIFLGSSAALSCEKKARMICLLVLSQFPKLFLLLSHFLRSMATKPNLVKPSGGKKLIKHPRLDNYPFVVLVFGWFYPAFGYVRLN